VANSVFLKFDGIDGESTQAGHDKWIEVLSFNHGLSMPMTSAHSGGAAKAQHTPVFQDFTISKYLDKTSVTLNLKCAGGVEIPKINVHVLTSAQAGEAPVVRMEWEFEKCFLSSIAIGGGTGDMPVETVSFTFSKVKWTYHVTGEGTGTDTGNVPTGWDLEKNVKV
jgi:type VI secretion system secreted protein Hcp